MPPAIDGRNRDRGPIAQAGLMSSGRGFGSPGCGTAVHGVKIAIADSHSMLQLGRVWVIANLGPCWTTRIITLPGAPLIRSGPFRLVRHPNSWVASPEIAILPLVFGQFWIALVFSLLNAILVTYCIRVEERARVERRT